MYPHYLIYFLTGVMLDIVYTVAISGIAEKNTYKAVIGSVALTLVSYTVLYNLILSPQFIANLLWYAAGGALGTFITLQKDRLMKLTTKTIAAGIIIIGCFLGYLILIQYVGHDILIPNQSAVISSPSNTRATYKYENIRIKQWKHYYNLPGMLNDWKRNFYITQIIEMFLQAGFDTISANIYAEIPTVETNWDIRATSKKGAIGLWGIMPATGKKYGITEHALFDPHIATVTAIRELKLLDSLMGHDIAKVLFSYNAGVGAVLERMDKYQTTDVWLVAFSEETYNFAPRVLGAYAACQK